MVLTDTHAHIHSKIYKLDPVKGLAEARALGVCKAICVGTDLEDSILATDFAKKHDGVWASIGIHPHDSSQYIDQPQKLRQFEALITRDKVVAVGECGLDFFYNHSPKNDQIRMLKFQIELALQNKLPLIFHVRDAFEDFWPIFDSYKEIRGVIHSFTADQQELDRILARGLYVGLNGIMTFTKKLQQLQAAAAVPLNRLVLETDAPFLTPAPYRGIIGQIKHVRTTAEFLADLRGESLVQIADATSHNAATLFKLK